MQNGNGIKPEICYTENFTSIFDSTTWIKIESPKWDAPEGEWTQESFFIQNPPEKLNIKFRFQSTEGNYASYLIDNFYVEGITTNSEKTLFAETNFKIYPNPITSNSEISFQLKICENVNLSIFDIQGQKICTLIDEKIIAGAHTIPLGNQIQTNGIYLCKLATSEGISTIKLIY